MNRCRSSLLTILIALLVAAGASADVIVLRDGKRLTGEIVDETSRAFKLRKELSSGRSGYVRVVPKSQVFRVYRQQPLSETRPAATSTRPASESDPSPETRSASTRPAEPVYPSAEQLAMFDTALSRRDAEDHMVAGFLLTRLIRNSSEGELVYLSDQCRDRTGLSLAELAAETHFKAALVRRRALRVRLTYVTPYEAPALVLLLEEAYQKALHQVVGVDSKSPASQPSESAESTGILITACETEKPSTAGRTIAPWLSSPTDYNGSPSDAEALAAHIPYVQSLLTERIRLDPELRRSRKLKTDLGRTKGQLSRLLDVVRDRASGALTPQERAAMLAQWQQQEEDYRQELLRWQRLQSERERQLEAGWYDHPEWQDQEPAEMQDPSVSAGEGESSSPPEIQDNAPAEAKMDENVVPVDIGFP